MIIGFSKHGTGAGKGPISYLTDPTKKGRETAPPVVLRGDAENTRRLIDSLTFKHKYTSGVLSFAPGETITPEMEQDIMDQFEALAFAGLDRDQYSILWVRHEHAGHHELHFVTPRIELSSGKSLNIRPPGKATQKQFDDLRSAINAQYGLADPEDPSRARNVAIPDHELKQAAEAMRAGQPPPENIRELIDTVFTQRAVHRLIRNRKELLDHAKSLGFKVPRAGKDSITLQDPKTSKRWRFKGPLYAANYEPGRLHEATSPTGQQPVPEAEPKAAIRFQERIAEHVQKRARYHRERYQKTSQKPPERIFGVQDSNSLPDRSELLSGALSRHLGGNAIHVGSDHSGAEPDSGPSTGRGPDSLQPMRWSSMRPDRRESGDLSTRLPHPEGVLNHDRTGATFIGRITRFRAALKAGAGGFARDVRSYLNRKRSLARNRHDLERSGRQLERATRQLNQMIRHPSKDHTSPSGPGFAA